MSVGLGRLCRGSVAPGADGPHWLICDHKVGDLVRRDDVKSILELTVEHRKCLVVVTLLECFADTHDWRQTRGDRRRDLPIDGRVRLAK